MILRTPRSTRTYTRFPYTPLFRSAGRPADHRRHVLSASAELRTGTDVEALRAVADRVAAQAGPGEQVEAYVSQGTNTRSEEHTSELQSLMRISYAVFCLKKKKVDRGQIGTAQI